MYGVLDEFEFFFKLLNAVGVTLACTFILYELDLCIKIQEFFLKFQGLQIASADLGVPRGRGRSTRLPSALKNQISYLHCKMTYF